MLNQEQKNERISVIVDAGLHDKLKGLADQEGLSLSKYCADMLLKKSSNLAEKEREIAKGSDRNEKAMIANSLYNKAGDYLSTEHAIAKVALETLLLTRSLCEHIVPSARERLDFMAYAEGNAKLTAHILANQG